MSIGQEPLSSFLKSFVYGAIYFIVSEFIISVQHNILFKDNFLMLPFVFIAVGSIILCSNSIIHFSKSLIVYSGNQSLLKEVN